MCEPYDVYLCIGIAKLNRLDSQNTHNNIATYVTSLLIVRRSLIVHTHTIIYAPATHVIKIWSMGKKMVSVCTKCILSVLRKTDEIIFDSKIIVDFLN